MNNLYINENRYFQRFRLAPITLKLPLSIDKDFFHFGFVIYKYRYDFLNRSIIQNNFVFRNSGNMTGLISVFRFSSSLMFINKIPIYVAHFLLELATEEVPSLGLDAIVTYLKYTILFVKSYITIHIQFIALIGKTKLDNKWILKTISK